MYNVTYSVNPKNKPTIKVARPFMSLLMLHHIWIYVHVVDAVNIYGLLTNCEVKMAGYWPSSFLRVYGDGVKVHNSRKKNETNIQPSWPNKLGQYRIYYMTFGEFFLQDMVGSPEQAR